MGWSLHYTDFFIPIFVQDLKLNLRQSLSHRSEITASRIAATLLKSMTATSPSNLPRSIGESFVSASR